MLLPVEQKWEPTHPGKKLRITKGLNWFWQESESTPDVVECVIPWPRKTIVCQLFLVE